MRKLLFFLIAVFILSIPSYAAISHDANSGPTSNTCGNVSTCSWNHTVASGASDLWVGFVYSLNNSPTITSVTCNGGSGTMVSVINNTDTVTNNIMYLYHFYSPTSGTNGITITLNTAPGNTKFMAASVSFLGSSTSALDNGTGAKANVTGGGAASISVNLTTANNNAWIIDIEDTANNGVIYSPSGSQTAVMNVKNGNQFGMSYQGPVTPAGSTADGWQWTGGNDDGAMAAVSIEPAGSAAATMPPAVY